MAYEVAIQAFIQPIEKRSKLSIPVDEGIPVIDLSVLNSPNLNEEGLIKEIGDACKDWGIFRVINHGLPSELQERILLESNKFFHLPLEEKRKVRRDNVNPMGYYEAEHTKNVRDWRELFDFTVEDPLVISPARKLTTQGLHMPKNRWPLNPPDFRDACSEYTKAVDKLGLKLFELISMSLGLERERLTSYFKNQTSRVRINNFPPCPLPHLVLGITTHRDAGALTIISQDDVSGLDVKRKSDGEWVRIKQIPNTFVVHLGDIMQVWTNDKYESIEHRVAVNSERERISIGFTFDPAEHVMVKPLEELINEENPSNYKGYNWWDFRVMRNFSNLKKDDIDDVEIDHFKASE